VAAAIERLHVDRLVEHVERLAHHARQGEVWDKAVRYLRQAGINGFLRSANREAAGSRREREDGSPHGGRAHGAAAADPAGIPNRHPALRLGEARHMARCTPGG
jgi:hypothetical protein